MSYTMPYVKMGDGTIYESATIGHNEDQIWIFFNGNSVYEMFPVVTNENKTSDIYYRLPGKQLHYKNFNIFELIAVNRKTGGSRVRLSGAEDYEIIPEDIPDEVQNIEIGLNGS